MYPCLSARGKAAQLHRSVVRCSALDVLGTALWAPIRSHAMECRSSNSASSKDRNQPASPVTQSRMGLAEERMKRAGAVKLADFTELTPKLIPAEGETLIVLTDKPCRTLKCVFFGSLFCVLLVEACWALRLD